MSTVPVQIYSDERYGGVMANVPYGKWTADQLGFPNQAQDSIKIAPFTKVQIYTDSNFGTLQTTLNGPRLIPDLKAIGLPKDSMRSIAVTEIPVPVTTMMNCCSGALNGADTCGKYTSGSQLCKDSVQNYCNSNMGLPACQSWCNQTHTCDSAAIEYCNGVGKGTPFCSCLNSKLIGASRYDVNPACFDADCFRTGYQTYNMRNPCPSIVNCSMQIDLRNSGIKIASTSNFEQNCGDHGTTTQTPVTTPPVSTTPDPIISLPTDWLQNTTVLYFLIFFVFLIFLFLIIVVVYVAL